MKDQSNEMKYVLKYKERSKMIRFSSKGLSSRQIEHVYKNKKNTLSPVRVPNVEYQSTDVIPQDRVTFFGYWIS